MPPLAHWWQRVILIGRTGLAVLTGLTGLTGLTELADEPLRLVNKSATMYIMLNHKDVA